MEARFYKGHTNLLDDYHLLSFDALDSTNEEAKRLARAGGAHGAVVWAKKQTGGKGRMGREWVSQEGNLFVSLLLKPEKPAAELAQLSFVASIAVVEALADMFGSNHKLTCKWPNDVLLDGKKLAGILLESFPCEKDGKQWLVAGVGVNVDSHPDAAQFPATCLTEAGVELVSAKIVLSRFIHHFIECYNEWENKGFAPIRKRWMANAWGMKKDITARLADCDIHGTAEDIDATGALVMKLAGGKKRVVHAADIFPAEKENA
ncbi:MAG: biotin--[acetyl-CoA-carboxylase] ligase [Alphaproteobacteria bacterium]|nr:biotin--[acetyl-CoA-carboxylase] ligase [Alphaproteobacteria bacterium]